jgi:hypothetical protein
LLRKRDGVEKNIDSARLLDPVADVLFDCVLVERVDLGDLGSAARRDDLPGDCFERRKRPAGEKHPRALARERAGDGAADGPSPAIDDSVLVFEQHGDCPVFQFGRATGAYGG